MNPVSIPSSKSAYFDARSLKNCISTATSKVALFTATTFGLLARSHAFPYFYHDSARYRVEGSTVPCTIIKNRLHEGACGVNVFLKIWELPKEWLNLRTLWNCTIYREMTDTYDRQTEECLIHLHESVVADYASILLLLSSLAATSVFLSVVLCSCKDVDRTSITETSYPPIPKQESPPIRRSARLEAKATISKKGAEAPFCLDVAQNRITPRKQAAPLRS